MISWEVVTRSRSKGGFSLETLLPGPLLCWLNGCGYFLWRGIPYGTRLSKPNMGGRIMDGILKLMLGLLPGARESLFPKVCPMFFLWWWAMGRGFFCGRMCSWIFYSGFGFILVVISSSSEIVMTGTLASFLLCYLCLMGLFLIFEFG